MDHERIAVLAHEKFPDRAKTALGVIRYGDQGVRAVLDRDRAGDRVADHVTDVADAPIVESFADAHAAADGDLDALYIGIAPIGGGFDESWRSDVEAAIEAGCDVVSGLHYFLNEDEELAGLAEEHGVDLVDVRRPGDDLTVASGASAEVDADVVLTVGTDCSVGKMTASLEIVAAARDRGIDAAFVPTGQTGIMIAGWGNPIDRIVSDFTAGAVEEMLVAAGDDHDLLVVEGQGSIVHPAYSAVTCGILHGSMADGLVLCHAADREVVHGYEEFDLPPLGDYVDLYEDLATPVHETEVVAGALNTKDVADEGAAAEAVTEFGDETGVPAADPVRDGADRIVDGIVDAGLGGE
ncbi:hypothetical protein C463_17123 [Halorubrum californiense DSM 19288]|uniref:DUF1611 domain-containing protein n=1 Tax=Halorubrum californiense DSM 19288 TaxID=1227465 RepID=M0DV56_9EURY|nr:MULTISPECIES: DUF1611 domain-containing protein [Halorubrum]ELZ39386.1 hypothetical protein C463_17123 [Halorubrum californiense DSM 19288]TKX72082.1 DUF1611 domain-containing protein [Halorubrum sp. GN11GM_10-3_MGM]